MALLDDIAGIRTEVIEGQKKTFPVPAWEEKGLKVTITCIPAEDETVQKILRQAGKKDKDANKNADLQLLVETVQEVMFDNGNETAVFEGFKDPELAEVLAYQGPQSARQTADALFAKDGDMHTMAMTIIDFSGYSSQSIQEDFSGE